MGHCQGLRDAGARWSSGPLALAAAEYDEHLFGVLGWFLKMFLPKDDDVSFLAWKLLLNAPYKSQINAILFPEQDEDARIRDFPEDEVEYARHIVWEVPPQLPKPPGDFVDIVCTAVRDAAQFRIVDIERIVIDEDCTNALDVAWRAWSDGHRRTGYLPDEIAKIINKVVKVDGKRHSNADLEAYWGDFRVFIVRLHNNYPEVQLLMDERPLTPL